MKTSTLLSGLALSFSLLLTSCALPRPVEGKFKDIDRIAVVAVFDETVATIINGQESTLEVKDWPINKIIRDELISSLKNAKKNSFALVTDPKVIKNGKDEALGLKNIYLGNRYQALENYLNVEAQKQGAEYLLVVHPASFKEFPQHRAGYGFQCQTEVKTQSKILGYFAMSADLWNVKTKEFILKVPLSPAQIHFDTGRPCVAIAKKSQLEWVSGFKNDILALAKSSASQIATSLSSQ